MAPVSFNRPRTSKLSLTEIQFCGSAIYLLVALQANRVGRLNSRLSLSTCPRIEKARGCGPDRGEESLARHDWISGPHGHALQKARNVCGDNVAIPNTRPSLFHDRYCECAPADQVCFDSHWFGKKAAENERQNRAHQDDRCQLGKRERLSRAAHFSPEFSGTFTIHLSSRPPADRV